MAMNLYLTSLTSQSLVLQGSFDIAGASLGFKTVSFSCLALNTLLYLGLPLSSPIVIERSFMCNTFRVAFLDHQSSKHRFMFNVEGSAMQHNYTGWFHTQAPD
jgi:hypothetical protein